MVKHLEPMRQAMLTRKWSSKPADEPIYPQEAEPDVWRRAYPPQWIPGPNDPEWRAR